MTDNKTAATTLNKDDQIVVTGAGGFIAGTLVRYFHDQGFSRIRAVDKKPLSKWYQRTPGVENLCLDVSYRDNCKRGRRRGCRSVQPGGRYGRYGFYRAF